MKRIGLRFPTWSRIFFTSTLLVSLATGLVWFYLGRWSDVEGEFGPEKHPWIPNLAKIHGAGAFAALVSFGMIFSSHLPIGWRTKNLRKSGLLTTACVLTMILTAWGLYYAGDDDWREVILLLHLSAGCSLPVAITLHIWPRKKTQPTPSP